MKNSKYFLLYSNCICIGGYTNTIIYDLLLYRYLCIPLALNEIINQARGKKLAELLCLFEEKYHKAIVENFERLVKEGFGFYTDDPSQFPDLDLYWDHPAIISNAIIDWSNPLGLSLKKTQILIEEIGCSAIQIIISSDLKKLENILKGFKEARVKSIELLATYVSKEHTKTLIALCEKYSRVSLLYFFNSPEYTFALSNNFLYKVSHVIAINRNATIL